MELNPAFDGICRRHPLAIQLNDGVVREDVSHFPPQPLHATTFRFRRLWKNSRGTGFGLPRVSRFAASAAIAFKKTIRVVSRCWPSTTSITEYSSVMIPFPGRAVQIFDL